MNNDNYREVEDVIIADSLFDCKNEKRVFSKLGFGFAMFSLVYLAVALIIQLVVYFISPEFFVSSLFANILSLVSIYLFGLPILLLMVGGVESEPPEKRKMKFSEWILILIVCFGVMHIDELSEALGVEIVPCLSDGYEFFDKLCGF